MHDAIKCGAGMICSSELLGAGSRHLGTPVGDFGRTWLAFFTCLLQLVLDFSMAACVFVVGSFRCTNPVCNVTAMLFQTPQHGHA